jgi:hypothetical protein
MSHFLCLLQLFCPALVTSSNTIGKRTEKFWKPIEEKKIAGMMKVTSKNTANALPQEQNRINLHNLHYRNALHQAFLAMLSQQRNDASLVGGNNEARETDAKAEQDLNKSQDSSCNKRASSPGLEGESPSKRQKVPLTDWTSDKILDEAAETISPFSEWESVLNNWNPEEENLLSDPIKEQLVESQ